MGISTFYLENEGQGKAGEKLILRIRLRIFLIYTGEYGQNFITEATYETERKQSSTQC